MLKKIILIILALIVVVAAVLVITNYDDIKALIISVRYSPEDIDKMSEQNDKIVQDAVYSLAEAPIAALSEDQLAALRNGTLSEDEAVELMLSGIEPPATEEGKTRLEAAKQVAVVYVMKDSFSFKLDNLLEEAKQDYAVLAGDGIDRTEVSKLFSKYSALAKTLESECDAKMDGVVDKLSGLIDKLDEDPSLVDSIKQAYAQEKSLRKAYYINLYKSKLGQ